MPQVLFSGYKSPRWNSNKTKQEREIERDYPEYKIFIQKVLSRDKYTCQCCKKTGIKLDVHHLDGYNWCKNKRTDETNGVTLCENCHNNFHLIYGRGNNTKEQYDEWIGNNYKRLEKYTGDLPTRKKVICIETNKIYSSYTEAAEDNNDSESNIKRCCNPNIILKSSKGKHYLWLDEYRKMSKEDLEFYIHNQNIKPVYCITHDKYFDSAISAAKFYNFSDKGKAIMLCCKNKTYYSGIIDDGTCLQMVLL